MRAMCAGACPSSVFAATSAPAASSCAAQPTRPYDAATCRGVHPRPQAASTSAPARSSTRQQGVAAGSRRPVQRRHTAAVSHVYRSTSPEQHLDTWLCKTNTERPSPSRAVGCAPFAKHATTADLLPRASSQITARRRPLRRMCRGPRPHRAYGQHHAISAARRRPRQRAAASCSMHATST